MALRPYSGLCAQESVLLVLRGPGMEPSQQHAVNACSIIALASANTICECSGQQNKMGFFSFFF